MKFIECAQGTPEWHAARSGKVTASRFADAISTVGGLDERQAKDANWGFFDCFIIDKEEAVCYEHNEAEPTY